MRIDRRIIAGSIPALATILTLIAPAHAQSIVREGTVAARPGPAANFTGQVRVWRLTSATPPGQAGTAMVEFAPAARTNWHSHPAGQTLHVVDGCGWTQEQGGTVARICKGDTVYVRPGVRHWHGGTDTTSMRHLAISEVLHGRNVTWLGPVTDAQYTGPER